MTREDYKLLLKRKRKELKMIISRASRLDSLFHKVEIFILENQNLKDIELIIGSQDYIHALDISVRSYNVIYQYIQKKAGHSFCTDFRIVSVFNAISEEGLLAERNCGKKTIIDIDDAIKGLPFKLKKHVSEEEWEGIFEDVKAYNERLKPRKP